MTVRILVGDCRERLTELPDKSIHCAVTSPPYFNLRSYLDNGHNDKHREIGTEQTLAEYVASLVAVFRDVRRILRDDGTLWLNLGDSYSGGGGYWPDAPSNQAGSLSAKHTGTTPYKGRKPTPGLKPKDLMMVPARVAIALVDDGWYLRSDIIWHKKAPLPESVRDRPTSAHEHVFLLSKRPTYFYDAEAVKEPVAEQRNYPTWEERKASGEPLRRGDPGESGHVTRFSGLGGDNQGRNLRNVWHLGPEPFPLAHFATFPSEIPRRAIKAGTSERGVCPACGSPWRRVVERERSGDALPMSGKNGRLYLDGTHGSAEAKTWNQLGPSVERSSVTTGWSPSCPCDAGDPVPATVLDPFAGSGTTGLVADQIGRHAVLIELSEDYARMAEARIRGDAPMFADVEVA